MSPATKSPRLRQGFTLIELLVVVTVIAILASMLMPLISIIKELANQTKCASNQAQMAGACEAYRASEDVPWAVPWANMVPTPPLPTAMATSNVDVYTFEVMETFAAATNLTGPLFKCPSANIGPAVTPHMPDGKNFWLTNNLGSGTPIRIPYAMDWASPSDAGSDRVIFADRDPKNHKGVTAMAAYADSHTKKLNKLASIVGSNVTYGQVANAPVTTGIQNPDTIGQPLDPVAAMNAGGTAAPDQTLDNIYDDNADSVVGYTAPSGGVNEDLTPGGGEAHRVWVK